MLSVPFGLLSVDVAAQALSRANAKNLKKKMLIWEVG